MVQRYEQMRRLQWYKCGAAYEQTDHSANDYEKVASDSIVKVPLQTVHKPENIWNSNADNKQDSLSTRDFSSHGFVEDKE